MMHAGIAGAGLVGRLLALRLLEAGWKVSLFDRDYKNGEDSCAQTAGGMIALVAELEKSPLAVFDYGLYSLKRWPTLIESLSAPVYYSQHGSIVTAHPQDEPEFQCYIDTIKSKLNKKEYYQELTQEALLTLEPELTKFTKAYYFPFEAQIDNQQLMKVLRMTLDAKNVAWYPRTTVQNIKPNEIMTQNETHRFDLVCDCRGLGAQSNWTDLRGVRGEVIWLHAPDVHLSRPIRMLHPRYSVYIVPRPGEIYIVGASEIESHDLSSISVRSNMELLSAAISLHSGFLEARILKTASHCRPAFPDHLPRIQYEKGFIAINGLYRHGFLLAPALIDQAMNLLEQEKEDAKHLFKWPNTNDITEPLA